MIVKNERPPIYAEARKYFDIDDSQTVYTYGDVLYNPAGFPIDPSLMVHEETHQRQQKQTGGPEKWWRQYFDDPIFRITQEVEAYGQQYKHYCTRQKDRNIRDKYLRQIAGHLSSGLYKINISFTDAKNAIKHYSK